MRAMVAMWLIAVIAACSGNSPTGPMSSGNGSVGNPGTSGGGGGGGSGGDTGGNTSGGTPTSGDVAVVVGNNFMKSGHNGSVNPAVDTVAAGGSVTWAWTSTGAVPHSIQSLGNPAFPSSAILSGNGSVYRVTFRTAGTYRYDCAVHGSMMSGTIVVQ
jgi:endo-1,4-beta-xylanase